MKATKLLNKAHDLYLLWLEENNIIYKRSANELLDASRDGKIKLTGSQTIFLGCYVVMWYELERTE